jgi:hypothetical protein
LSLRIRPPANLRIKPLLRKECSLDRNCNRQASKIAERVLVLCSRHPQPPPQLMQNLLLTTVYSLGADSPFPGQIGPGHMQSDRVSGFFSEAPGEGEIQNRTRPLSQLGHPVVSSMPPTQEMQANRESGHRNRPGPEEFSASPPPRRPSLASASGPVHPSLIHRSSLLCRPENWRHKKTSYLPD